MDFFVQPSLTVLEIRRHEENLRRKNEGVVCTVSHQTQTCTRSKVRAAAGKERAHELNVVASAPAPAGLSKYPARVFDTFRSAPGATGSFTDRTKQCCSDRARRGDFVRSRPLGGPQELWAYLVCSPRSPASIHRHGRGVFNVSKVPLNSQ
jgi:hypothetical protein